MMTAMAPFQKGAVAIAGARPCPPRHHRHGFVRTITHGTREASGEPVKCKKSIMTACQQSDSAMADSGASTAVEELETFETHVGMVEPVDEDDAEVSP